MIDRIGEDRVLFETDFPHPSCLYPRSREHLQKVLGEMPETTRRKVLCDNAASLYGITVG
jgi:predicted TIM-barrel fold metal-dependent hydrolase